MSSIVVTTSIGDAVTKCLMIKLEPYREGLFALLIKPVLGIAKLL